VATSTSFSNSHGPARFECTCSAGKLDDITSTRHRAPAGSTHSIGQKSMTSSTSVPGVTGACGASTSDFGYASVAAFSRTSSAWPSCSAISRATNAVSGAVDFTTSLSCAVPDSRTAAFTGSLLNVSTSSRAQFCAWSTGPGQMPSVRKNANDSSDAPPRVGTGFFGSYVYETASLGVLVVDNTPPSQLFDCAPPPSSYVVGSSPTAGHRSSARYSASPTPHTCTVPGFNVASGLPLSVWSNHSRRTGH
jgi:hypothetical protein